MANFKNSRAAKLFYYFPGVVSAYHFLWAWAGSERHRHPSRKLVVIGVTGTKGKTTMLELLNAILEAAGKRTALLSSLREKIAEHSAKNRTGNSMPGRASIQRFLRRAVAARCDYALIEVTSQGVVLHRHRFIRWDVGVLTNLHPEHIEAHGSYENYRAAKLSFLWYVLRRGGKVFLNRDDKEYPFFMHALTAGQEGKGAPAHYSKEDEFIKDFIPRLRAAGGSFLVSDFNIEHIAVAATIAQRLGIDKATIERAVLGFPGVPGRMEFVRAGEYTGVVDYAHTPDSLEAAYRAVKPQPTVDHPHPRLIAILGAAGGGRDKWKRPAMGAVAARWCDEIILTDEDPYDEDPSAIVDEIERGVRNALAQDPGKLKHVHRVMDRRAAIREAFAHARPGDIVIGTGKGSEEWIHRARGAKEAWSERGEFEAALAARTHGA
jgi:UDP-N-acetylmuramoyl-L-alanyl-D-glutamate--2,6-diaminopimelate ligase